MELEPTGQPGENYVYMLRCVDGTLYTGWTNSLEQRVKAHNAGLGAKYTRARLPVRLVYRERCESKVQAMRREYEIKQFSRRQKLTLAGLPAED